MIIKQIFFKSVGSGIGFLGFESWLCLISHDFEQVIHLSEPQFLHLKHRDIMEPTLWGYFGEQRTTYNSAWNIE